MLKKENADVKKTKKKIIIYSIIMLIDIIMIFLFAKRNILHFVVVGNKKVNVSGTNRMLFGKNYITLIVTFFLYIYICMINKVVFKEKKKELFYVILFLGLIIINILLFVICSKRVY